jgi:hypothetical protein
MFASCLDLCYSSSCPHLHGLVHHPHCHLASTITTGKVDAWQQQQQQQQQQLQLQKS